MSTNWTGLAATAVVGFALGWYVHSPQSPSFEKGGGIGRQSVERIARDKAAVDRRIAKLVRSESIKNDVQLHSYEKRASEKARERSYKALAREEQDMLDGLGKKWDKDKVADYYLERSKTWR